MDDIADARKTAPHSIPAPPSIPGTVMRMYAIDRNVVNPATASFMGVVPCPFSPNMSRIRRLDGHVRI